MFHRLLRDTAIYAISAALSRGVAIVLLPLYTRFLSPSEYGALDLLMIVATLSSYLVSLEISQGLARVYSEAITLEDKRSCVSSAAWFVLIAYGLFTLGGLVLAPGIAVSLLDSTGATLAVRTMILAVAANGVFFLLQDLLRWELQPKKYAWSSITYALVSATAGASAVVFLRQGVVGVLSGQIVGAMAGLAVASVNGASIHWRLTFDRARLREMLSYSTPQVISSLTAYSALYVDRFFIKGMLGLEAVGIYGVGARIASLVLLLMAGFQSGYIPIVFRSHREPGTPAQMAKVFQYFLIAALAIMLGLSAYSRELLSVFTTQHYFEFWYTIPILATALMLGNMYIFAPGIFIARRTGYVAVINVGSALLNMVLILLLLPWFGVLGAAIATLISSMAAFLTYVFFNSYFYPIPFAWPRIIAASLLGFLFSIALVMLQFASGPWIIFGKAFLCMGGIALTASTLLEKGEFRRLASKLGRP